MTGPDAQWQVAECLMPGLSRATAEELGRRVRQELAGAPGGQVSFLGALLMPEDEVLLCLFDGAEPEVRAVSERAGVPFERILACVAISWRTGPRAGHGEPVQADRPAAARPTGPSARTGTHGESEWKE